MDLEETMVDVEDEVAEDDTPLDDFVEEDESEDFEELPDEEEEIEEEEEADEEYEEEEEEPEEEEPVSEPGWMKKRIGKAVEKAVAQALAQQREEFEEQMRPFREKMMEDEAQALVASRKVTDIETARELVRYRQGATPQTEEEQPRNENGQFASREQIAEEARINARIDMLTEQRNKILRKTGFVIRSWQYGIRCPLPSLRRCRPCSQSAGVPGSWAQRGRSAGGPFPAGSQRSCPSRARLSRSQPSQSRSLRFQRQGLPGPQRSSPLPPFSFPLPPRC